MYYVHDTLLTHRQQYTNSITNIYMQLYVHYPPMEHMVTLTDVVYLLITLM